MSDQADNLAESEVAPEADPVEDESLVETEAQADNDEESPDEDPETEEIEFEGAKYRVPRALKDGFLMRADHTRKTQELAETKRRLEAETAAEKAKVAEVDEEIVATRAKVFAADERIAQYQKIDWRAWSEQDPAASQAAFMDYQQLRETRADLAQAAETKASERALEAQRIRAEQAEQGWNELSRDIKGWSPELADKLADFAVKEGLYTSAEVKAITDAKTVKLLHRAYLGTQAAKTQAQAQKHEKTLQVQPAAAVAGRGAPKTGLDDRLSAEEWTRRRNEQLKQKAG
jgi:hypothetical protein